MGSSPIVSTIVFSVKPWSHLRPGFVDSDTPRGTSRVRISQVRLSSDSVAAGDVLAQPFCEERLERLSPLANDGVGVVDDESLEERLVELSAVLVLKGGW